MMGNVSLGNGKEKDFFRRGEKMHLYYNSGLQGLLIFCSNFRGRMVLDLQ